LEDAREFYVIGNAEHEESDEELTKINVKENKKLKGLRDFLGNSSVD
jgi:hypothetical protein